ncbi:hypothetical protein K488DRAFT_88401 [Vararia minispora EC-137]|uniref:Uncharacterized protein n=1 Tax=Vararia minispora EC-137 TaxID=1314806 RepID=A0ACB8QDE7_9AGAM|nr:hypothetical protein K488DRAFT_88401 [Vararia minispora EC-137]
MAEATGETLSRKRPRIDLNLSPVVKYKVPSLHALSLAHHPALWFDDGDIILAAGTTAFKVDHAIIKRHSRLLFDIITSMDARACVEVPVYDVEDTAENVETVLKWIYQINRCRCVRLTMKDCARYLYLGAHYGVDNLKMTAVQCLAETYPTTLEVYDRLLNTKDPAHKAIPLFDDGDHFVAAFLARHYNLAQILPLVLLICRMYGEEDLVKHFEDAVNNLSHIPACVSEEAQIWLLKILTRSRPKIPNPIIGGDGLVDRQVCGFPARCYREISRAHLCPIEVDDEMPLAPFEQRPALLVNGVCFSCISLWKGVYEQERKKFWEGLPQCFGLASWDELGKDVVAT